MARETVDSSRPRRRPRRPASSRPLRLGLDARAVELELGLGVGCRRLPLPRLALLLTSHSSSSSRAPAACGSSPCRFASRSCCRRYSSKAYREVEEAPRRLPTPHPRAPPADRRLALGVGRAEQADAAGLGDPQLLADRGDEVLVVGDDEQPAPVVHVPAASPTADMSHRAGEERRTRTLAARGSAPPPANANAPGPLRRRVADAWRRPAPPPRRGRVISGNLG